MIVPGIVPGATAFGKVLLRRTIRYALLYGPLAVTEWLTPSRV
jgi:hypothetical protein